MGTPAFALPILEELLNSTHEVVGVYTSPDRPQGRGRVRKSSPVKEWALEKGLPLFQPSILKNSTVQREFSQLAPDLVVVAAYGRIIPSELLKVPSCGFLNIHPSLLPAYRGPSPVVTAILDGLHTTGVSLILLDEGLDSGPILAQRPAPIDPDDTAEALTLRLFQMGAELMGETLPLWVKGQLTPTPQDTMQATHTQKITKGDGQVRWEMTGEELYRRHRAFTPWPGLYTYWRGRVLKLLDVQPLDEVPSKEFGSVVPIDREELTVGVTTGEGLLGIGMLQLEGRQALSAQEFVRGHPDFLSSRLPS